MGNRAFELVSETVPTVETKNRKICTPIPHPDSIEPLKKLRESEPQSMRGQPLVMWDRAEGVNVYDPYGNKWLDFSSGVLVANAGHGNPEIVKAIHEAANKPLLHTYCFPHMYRIDFTSMLAGLLPWDDAKVFLLTTGSEANEAAIKLAITKGISIQPEKDIVVSFNGDFHGRTMGSQYIGGIPALKNWMRPSDQFVQMPWPGDLRVDDKSFSLFEKSLAEKNVDPANVAAVVFETYQGGNAQFAPVEYMKSLRKWCDQNHVVMIADEVQAGFGRCGTMFGWENYDIIPDLACFGKGISSGLPISATVGGAELMDQYAPGSMTSTHTGNTLVVAASIANLKYILDNDLPAHAKQLGEEVLMPGLKKIAAKHADYFPEACGKGLVATLQACEKGGKQPNAELAFVAVKKSVEKGLLFFAPVGTGGATIKISPPLVIEKDQLEEGLSVLGEAIDEAVAELYG